MYVSLFQAGQDLNRNARMLDLKALEQRREMPRRKTRRRRKTDLAFERAVVILQSVHQRVVRPQNRFHAFVRHAACIREDQLAHAVADKLNAEGALEPRNGAGNTRGFCFQRFCRCRQRAASGKTMKERQACRSSVFAIKASLLYCTQHFLLHEGTPKPNRFAAAASFHDVSA